MNFLSHLTRMLAGRRSADRTSSAASQLASQTAPSTASASVADSQRELLRVALRDTLRRQGIPESWISGEMLRSNSRQRGAGIHWRLTLRHWDERLPVCLVALQEHLVQHVQGFDPAESDSWLHGISWQFRIERGAGWPAMPPADSWTTAPVPPASALPAPAPTMPATDPVLIQGPTHVGAAPTPGVPAENAVRAQLDKLLAGMDEDYRAAAAGRTPAQLAAAHSFMKTEPASLR